MSTPTWKLPLHQPPRVLRINIGGAGDHIPPPCSYLRLGFWSLHLYRWRGSVSVDGLPVPVLPGHAGICPIAERIDYRFETAERHLYVHFLAGAGESVPMPALIDCGDAFEDLHAQLHEAIGWAQSAPARANARLWDVLWRLHRLPASAAHPDRHPAVAAARHLIEQNLREPIAIAELASLVDCSHNHLIRLFRAELGTTIVAYIRQRRLEHARMLLECASMPIAAVAAEVGIPDVARFAKLARRAWGRPPSAIRAAAQR